MADINTLKNGLIVTAFWEAKPDEVNALVGIIGKFLPQAIGVIFHQRHQQFLLWRCHIAGGNTDRWSRVRLAGIGGDDVVGSFGVVDGSFLLLRGQRLYQVATQIFFDRQHSQPFAWPV